MGVAVGDEDCAADALGRRVGERASKSGKELGPFGFRFVAGGFDDPYVDVSERLEPRLEFVARFVCLLRPLPNALALRSIDHHGDNVLKGTAALRTRLGSSKASSSSAMLSARSHAPRTPRQMSPTEMTSAVAASPQITGHEKKGEKAIDQALNESAFQECPWRGPDRPYNCQ